jgi:6-phosphogluconolactonase (cycloisomerase 2 family)
MARRRKMRMKFNKTSQLLLVSAASLVTAALMTSCGTNTVDFVYVASSLAAGTYNYGQIDVFEINAVSGFMRQIPASPFPSAGRDPVALAVASDYSNLYVVNKDDNTIVQFMIGSDGKLYPENTVNTPGIYPIADTVHGLNLFVLDTYQPLQDCSTADPCSGSVGVFPLAPTPTNASLTNPGGAPGPDPVANGSLNYWPLTLPGNPSHIIVPTGINVLQSGAYLYVTAYDSTASPNVGYVFGFSVGTGGALATLNGGVPFIAGVHPSAIASGSNTAGTYIYVTDSTNGNVLGYAVSSSVSTAGFLTPLGGSPYPAGNQPSAIAVDPNYPFAYVTNSLDGNVEAYGITSTGALANVEGSSTPVTYTSGIQPVAIGIDPGTSHFVFAVNFLGNGANGSIADFLMNTTSGTLINAQHSPYSTNALPTAVAAVPHDGGKPQ